MAPSELLKYSWRIEKFITKFANKEPFEFLDDKFRTLQYSEDVVKHLLERNLPVLQKPILLDEEDVKHRFGELKKTAEFGGKGKNFSIRIELEQISNIQKILDKIKWDIVLGTPQ